MGIVSENEPITIVVGALLARVVIGIISAGSCCLCRRWRGKPMHAVWMQPKQVIGDLDSYPQVCVLNWTHHA